MPALHREVIWQVNAISRVLKKSYTESRLYILMSTEQKKGHVISRNSAVSAV